MPKINPKQSAFVEQYLIDRNATAAAGRAGYSDPNYGRQLLTNPNVEAAIKAGLDTAAQEAQVSAQWVLERLKGEATHSGGDSSHSARVAALKLLGQHLGMSFTDKIDHTTKGEKLEPTVSVYLPSNGRDATPD